MVAASTMPVPRMLVVLEAIMLADVVLDGMLEVETIELVVDELVNAASTKLLDELVIGQVPLSYR